MKKVLKDFKRTLRHITPYWIGKIFFSCNFSLFIGPHSRVVLSSYIYHHPPSFHRVMTSIARPSPKLPSVVFAIPLPKPVQSSSGKKKLPTFALYTFPRSVYQKPTKDPLTGEKPKEKMVKKLERKWQHEVKEGQDIKNGIIKDARPWKRLKGSVINAAASLIQWMPSNVIETLARLPPIKKLGKLFVYYPHPADIPSWFNLPELNEKRINRSFFNLLKTAKDKSKTRTVASGCLLPVTLAIDILVIVPLFIFEINLAYFIMQITGSKKATRFVDAQKKMKSKPMETATATAETETEAAVCEFKHSEANQFDRTLEHVYSICSSLDPINFPINHSLPQPTSVPNQDIVTGFIDIFTRSLPPNVVSRHVLDHHLLAIDLDRSLRKAIKEYISTLPP